MCWGGSLLSAECHRGPDSSFDQERVFRFRTLHQWCVNFSPRFFIRFGHPTAENSDLSFRPRCDQIGQYFRILTWREYFASENYASGTKSFPPGFLTHFGRPVAKNCESGLFDHRATKWCFWMACDQNLDSVLLRCDNGSNFQNFDVESLWIVMGN